MKAKRINLANWDTGRVTTEIPSRRTKFKRLYGRFNFGCRSKQTVVLAEGIRKDFEYFIDLAKRKSKKCIAYVMGETLSHIRIPSWNFPPEKIQNPIWYTV